MCRRTDHVTNKKKSVGVGPAGIRRRWAESLCGHTHTRVHACTNKNMPVQLLRNASNYMQMSICHVTGGRVWRRDLSFLFEMKKF